MTDVKYKGLTVRTHFQVITTAFQEMGFSYLSVETPVSNLWTHAIGVTSLLGNNTITFSVSLILRNQSDLSNILILLGSYSVRDSYNDRTKERIMRISTEYLFDVSNKYLYEKKIKGLNEKDFIAPPMIYTDDYFINDFKS